MAEAKLNREYAVRILGVGALMVAICAWSLYDGLVAWPQCNRDMEQTREELLATNLTAEVWLGEAGSGQSPIDRAFLAKGGKAPGKLIRKLSELKVPEGATDRAARSAVHAEQITKIFQAPVYSAHDLQTQFVQAAVTLALGLCAFCVIGLRSRKRFIADDAGLSGNGVGDAPVAYAEIRSVDWTKWDEKGIVTLTLKSQARITLDGWHYSGITGIVDEILKHRPELAPPKG